MIWLIQSLLIWTYIIIWRIRGYIWSLSCLLLHYQAFISHHCAPPMPCTVLLYIKSSLTVQSHLITYPGTSFLLTCPFNHLSIQCNNHTDTVKPKLLLCCCKASSTYTYMCWQLRLIQCWQGTYLNISMAIRCHGYWLWALTSTPNGLKYWHLHSCNLLSIGYQTHNEYQ